VGGPVPGVAQGREAMFALRTRFFLTLRLVTRAFQFWSPAGAARRSPWRAIGAAWVAADVAVWAGLRRSDRLWLGPRLVLDSADIALWACARPDQDPSLVMSGVPLAVEAGVELGVAGLVVPAVELAVTAAARRGKGGRVNAASFGWQVFAVAGGGLIRRVERRRARRAQLDTEHRLSALAVNARLAGQNDIAMGADSVIDLLLRTSLLLGPPPPGSALERIGSAWKASLAAATSEHATYLGTALAKWQRRHNLHPDLAARVVISQPQGEGTVLLTGDQELALTRLLDDLDLAGWVQVEAAGSLARRVPGAPLQLSVSGRGVRVPGDAQRQPPAFDPVPAVLVLGAVWSAVPATSAYGAAPAWTVLPAVAAYLGVAGALWGRGEQAGDVRRWVPRFTIVAALTETAMITPRLRQPFTIGGQQAFPFLNLLIPTFITAPLYTTSVTRRDRQLLAAAAAGVVMLGWARSARPRRLLHLVLDASWSFTWLLQIAKLRDAIDHGAARAAVVAGDEATATTQRAYRDGQVFVIELVTRAVEEAEQQLGELDGHDPTVVAEIARRLTEVRRRLADLHPAAA